jgi:hypothetical protein
VPHPSYPPWFDQPRSICEEHKLWWSSLYCFLHPAVTSCLSGANILFTPCPSAPVISEKCWDLNLNRTISFPPHHSLSAVTLCGNWMNLRFIFEIFRIVRDRVHLCIVAWYLAQACDKWSGFAFQNGELHSFVLMSGTQFPLTSDRPAMLYFRRFIALVERQHNCTKQASCAIGGEGNRRDLHKKEGQKT